MTLVAIAAYIHNGRKTVRPLPKLNPYPKGFNRDTAVIHAKQAVAAMENTDHLNRLQEDGVPPIPPFILQAYAHAAHYSLKLAQAGLHSATDETLPSLLKEAADMGLPPGALTEMVNKSDRQRPAGRRHADPGPPLHLAADGNPTADQGPPAKGTGTRHRLLHPGPAGP